MSINKIKCVMSAMEYIKLTSKLQFGTQQKLSAEKKIKRKIGQALNNNMP